MNVRAKTMENLYLRNKVTKDGLRKAVIDGTITEQEYETITGETY